MTKIKREEMIKELEQYFEAAGFEDIKLKKLDSMDQSELKKLYKSTFNKNYNDSNLTFKL